eukprot:g842.t1
MKTVTEDQEDVQEQAQEGGGSVYNVEAAHASSRSLNGWNDIEMCKPRTVSAFIEVEHRRYGQTWVRAAASAEALQIADGNDKAKLMGYFASKQSAKLLAKGLFRSKKLGFFPQHTTHILMTIFVTAQAFALGFSFVSQLAFALVGINMWFKVFAIQGKFDDPSSVIYTVPRMLTEERRKRLRSE